MTTIKEILDLDANALQMPVKRRCVFTDAAPDLARDLERLVRECVYLRKIGYGGIMMDVADELAAKWGIKV